MTFLTRFFIDQTGNSPIQYAVIFALFAITGQTQCRIKRFCHSGKQRMG